MNDEHNEQDEANAMEDLVERFREQNPGTELDEERFRQKLADAIAHHPDHEAILQARERGAMLYARPHTAAGEKLIELSIRFPDDPAFGERAGKGDVMGSIALADVMRPPHD